MIVLCDMQGGIRNICVSLLKRYDMKSIVLYLIHGQITRVKFSSFSKTLQFHWNKYKTQKRHIMPQFFAHAPTPPYKIAFTGSKKPKNACKVALCSQMQLGVCLHFRAISTNTSSPRGLYHHKHGFLIDKLPIPPFLINKIFTHLIFTQPKYPPPIHPITPLFSRPIYHT